MFQSRCLPQIGGFIGGAWAGSRSGEVFAVRDPATGEVLAEVPAMGAAETAAAIEAAALAGATVATVAERRVWLRSIAQLLLANRDELAVIITREQGKPLQEAAAEVSYAAGFFAFFAESLHHLEANELGTPASTPGLSWTVYQRPCGVAALITPWNFPLAMLAKKLAAALAAGCSAVIKPAELTPLSAMALCSLTQSSGVLPGLINLVTGPPQPIGLALCSHPAVRLVSFTGSTEVGRILMAQCAPHLKRMALELGGNAPFIVCGDADIEAAADALMATKFRCAGQTCVCANRIFVDRRVAADFTSAVCSRVRGLVSGNGLDAGVTIGPLIDRTGWDKVARHVHDARAHGAVVELGDEPPRPAQDWAAFYPPTVLSSVSPEMLVSREETFGPVVAIATFDTAAQAVAAANATSYGLAAYLFSSDAGRACKLAAELQFGHVAINSGHGPTPEAPFGGVKQSGFGREGGIEGLLEFCDSQSVATAH
jgi:succinate-semialdehyde dehydrogenase/glutarate-semialdehyde dehydrogenase